MKFTKSVTIMSSVLLMAVGCASFNSFVSNPIIEELLMACQDVPLEEVDTCLENNLAVHPDADDLTTADLLELFEAFEALAEALQTQPEPAE